MAQPQPDVNQNPLLARWEPDARNRAIQRIIMQLGGVVSSDPGAQGLGTGYGGGVSLGGGTIADLAQQDVSNVSKQQLPSDYVAQTAKAAGAEGRSNPNITDLLKLAVTFPELAVQEAVQAAISGVTLPGDVASGKQQLTDPTTGHITDESLGRVLDLTGLAASGGVAGPAEATAGEVMGSGPMRIRSAAVRLKGKVYEGRDHLEAADAAAQANGIDENDIYNHLDDDGGFVTDDGEYVDRVQANQIAATSGQLYPDVPKDSPYTRAEDMDLHSGSKEQAAVAEAAGQAPELYSHAARVVDSLPAGKAPAAQWISTLKNKGVKDEELSNLNLPATSDPLTKDQLKAHIDANTPQLKDVVKQDVRDWKVEHGLKLPSDPTASDLPAKYSQYQLPGGTNYHEILTTLPRKGELNASEKLEFSRLQAAQQDGYPLSAADQARYKELMGRSVDASTDPNTYRSSHWDEPNVLAHTRVNDRYIDAPPAADIPKINRKVADATGVMPQHMASGMPEAMVKKGVLTPVEAGQWATAKGWQTPYNDLPEVKGLKTLHTEELQSDWHQAGRKKGYQDNSPENSQYEITGDGPWSIRSKTGRFITDFSNKQEAESYLNRLQKGGIEDNGRSIGVPDAPFKKSWPDLLIKKLALRAHNEGYDAISWTDGATQADRYDLSKQVKLIRYNPDTGALNAYPTTSVGPGGTVISEPKVPKERLADFIGKEAADKILNNPTRIDNIGVYELSGIDLKVGGEGMKAFYDQELPRRAKKILGAPVEKRSLGNAAAGGKYKVDRDPEDPNKWAVIETSGSGDYYGGFNSEAAARQHAAILPGGQDSRGDTNNTNVHFVRLTPEIKDRIKKGFPLFASGLPVPAPVAQPASAPVGAPVIDRTKDVPSFAGSSNDNKTVFVDRHIPQQVTSKGISKPFVTYDPAKYFVTHETIEHKLMATPQPGFPNGMPYEKAHQIALQAERAAVEADDIDWRSYSDHMNGMMHDIEKEPIKNPPVDQYMKVYHTPEWGHEAAKMQNAIDHRRHIDRRSGVRLVPVTGGNNGQGQ